MLSGAFATFGRHEAVYQQFLHIVSLVLFNSTYPFSLYFIETKAHTAAGGPRACVLLVPIQTGFLCPKEPAAVSSHRLAK